MAEKLYSLERRLKLRLLLGVGVVGLVLALAVRWQVDHQQRALLDYQLEQVARAMVLNDIRRSDFDWDDDPALHLDVQIWDHAERLLYTSSDSIELGVNTPSGFSRQLSGSQRDSVPLRVFTLRSNERTVQVMHPVALRRALIWDAEREVLLPTLLAMLIAAALTAATIRRGLEPIRDLDRELAQRASASLHPVSVPNAPAELQQVVGTLNSLLAQLEQSLAAHRRFIADAAHELRTPLTALRLEAAQLARESGHSGHIGSGTERQVVERLLGTADRIQRLVQQMLTLARLEAQADAQGHAPLDLAALARQALIDMAPLAQAREVELALVAPETLAVHGETPALRMLLDNLIGNAVKFSPAGTLVTVQLQAGQPPDAAVVLEVRDQGPGIPEHLRERVQRPFVRGTGSSEGSGLGLSIAAEVARAHGSSLVLLDAPEGGLLVRVALPAGFADQTARAM